MFDPRPFELYAFIYVLMTSGERKDEPTQPGCGSVNLIGREKVQVNGLVSQRLGRTRVPPK